MLKMENEESINYVIIILVITSLFIWFLLGLSITSDISTKIDNAIKICEDNNLEYITEHELIECGQFDNNGELIQIKKFINNWEK